MAPPSPQKDAEEAQKALRNGGIPVFKRAIRASKIYSQAALASITPSDLGGRGKVYWRDWPSLLSEIQEELNNGV